MKRPHRRVGAGAPAALLGAALLAAPVMTAGAPARDGTLSLSLDEFAELALRNSLRAKNYRNSLEGADLSFRIGYRGTLLPRISASASGQRSYSVTDPAPLPSNAGSMGPVSTYGSNFSETGSLDLPLYATGGSLSASVSQSRSLSNTHGNASATETSPDWSLSYTQPLFLFTGDSGRRNWRRTLLGYQTTMAGLGHEGLSIWVDARKLYYQTLQQQATLGVEANTLRSSRELLGIARALTRAGRYAAVELNRAELRHSIEQRRESNAKTSLEQQLNTVRNFIQLPPNARLQLTTRLQYKSFDLTANELLNTALANRQDYLGAKASVEAAEIALKDTRETTRPLLSLTGAYSSSRLIPSQGHKTTTYGWTVQGLATWLLFDAGTSRMKVRQSVIDLDNARIALERTRQQVRVDVDNNYLSIKNLETQLQDFKANREQAAKNLQAVKYRYRNGVDRLIDVFDAENVLRSLELEYLGVLINYHTALDQMALVINKRLPERS